jgi:hypothetical protein
LPEGARHRFAIGDMQHKGRLAQMQDRVAMVVECLHKATAASIL